METNAGAGTCEPGKFGRTQTFPRAMRKLLSVAAVLCDSAAPAAACDYVATSPPTTTGTSSGTAVPRSTWAYAQFVDLDSGHVVGNQATPIPLTLDGASHAIERSLDGIAHSATPVSRLQLQIIPATALYREQTSTGVVTSDRVDVTLPAAPATG